MEERESALKSCRNQKIATGVFIETHSINNYLSKKGFHNSQVFRYGLVGQCNEFILIISFEQRIIPKCMSNLFVMFLPIVAFIEPAVFILPYDFLY